MADDIAVWLQGFIRETPEARKRKQERTERALATARAENSKNEAARSRVVVTTMGYSPLTQNLMTPIAFADGNVVLANISFNALSAIYGNDAGAADDNFSPYGTFSADEKDLDDAQETKQLTNLDHMGTVLMYKNAKAACIWKVIDNGQEKTSRQCTLHYAQVVKRLSKPSDDLDVENCIRHRNSITLCRPDLRAALPTTTLRTLLDSGMIGRSTIMMDLRTMTAMGDSCVPMALRMGDKLQETDRNNLIALYPQSAFANPMQGVPRGVAEALCKMGSSFPIVEIGRIEMLKGDGVTASIYNASEANFKMFAVVDPSQACTLAPRPVHDAIVKHLCSDPRRTSWAECKWFFERRGFVPRSTVSALFGGDPRKLPEIHFYLKTKTGKEVQVKMCTNQYLQQRKQVRGEFRSADFYGGKRSFSGTETSVQFMVNAMPSAVPFCSLGISALMGAAWQFDYDNNALVRYSAGNP